MFHIPDRQQTPHVKLAEDPLWPTLLPGSSHLVAQLQPRSA